MVTPFEGVSLEVDGATMSLYKHMSKQTNIKKLQINIYHLYQVQLHPPLPEVVES
jgi:hypothetical protein